MSKEPRTLVEAIRYFADPDVAFETMVSLRFPEGVHCPTCGRTDVRFISTRKMWECKEKHPRKQFSVKVGTIFEDSALPLDKWLIAIWMIANMKNGVSSMELSRSLDITQKSAWHMLHRIRVAMKVGSISKMGGETEVDETYVGGKRKNMHAKRAEKVGVGGAGKAIVAGVVERSNGRTASRVRAYLIQNTRVSTIQQFVRDNVEPGSRLLTDSHSGYVGMEEYKHEFVNHSIEYVRGSVHTNSIENYWSLLKRSLRGTYVSVDPIHLARYVDEQSFRFNERKEDDATRFQKVVRQIVGLRLTWKELTGHAEAIA